MIKSSTSALAILVAIAGLTAPALAASSLVDEPSDNEDFNETIVLQQLRAQGYDASDLAEWDGKIRATVRQEDGGFTFVYFEPGTLEQVSPSGDEGGNTRVLSQRDLGPDARVFDTTPQSLVGDGADDDDN